MTNRITNAIDRGVEEFRKSHWDKSVSVEDYDIYFLRTFATSILQAVVESLPESREWSPMPHNELRIQGWNKYREATLAPLLEAIGEKKA